MKNIRQLMEGEKLIWKDCILDWLVILLESCRKFSLNFIILCYAVLYVIFGLSFL